MTEIEVCRRMTQGKYHAQIKDQPGRWSQGDSIDDAIGNLVRCHPGSFGIQVTHLTETR